MGKHPLLVVLGESLGMKEVGQNYLHYKERQWSGTGSIRGLERHPTASVLKDAAEVNLSSPLPHLHLLHRS